MHKCKKCGSILMSIGYRKYKCNKCQSVYKLEETTKRETGYVYDTLVPDATFPLLYQVEPVSDSGFGGSGGGGGSSRSWDDDNNRNNDSSSYNYSSSDSSSSSDSGSSWD
jgi:hypothetical protein